MVALPLPPLAMLVSPPSLPWDEDLDEEEGDDDDIDWWASFSSSGDLVGRVAIVGLSKET